MPLHTKKFPSVTKKNRHFLQISIISVQLCHLLPTFGYSIFQFPDVYTPFNFSIQLLIFHNKPLKLKPTLNMNYNDKFKETKKNERYQIESTVLGEGGLGKVYKAYDSLTEQEIAIKELFIRPSGDSFCKEFYNEEVRALKDLKGKKNILLFKDSFKINDTSFIVTELCKGGNLSQKIKREEISKQKAVDLMREILLGYSQIYSLGYIHRDLKPSNIFLSDLGAIKIGDFGFAIKQNEGFQSKNIRVGSPNYMAPEVIKYNQYSSKSDIWALGLIFYELYYGKKLWRFRNQKHVYQAQLKACRKNSHFADQLQEICSLFLKKTLCLNSSERAAPHQLLQILQAKPISEPQRLLKKNPIDFNIVSETIKTCFQLNSFILALLDLINCLKRGYHEYIDRSVWNKFINFLHKEMKINSDLIRQEQEKLIYLGKDDPKNKQIRKMLQLFEETMGITKKQNLGVSGSKGQSKKVEELQGGLFEFLEWSKRTVSKYFPYKFFLLYDYLITFAWIKNMTKNGMDQLKEQKIQISKIVDSLQENLQKCEYECPQIRSKDLQLLEFKVNSLKSMKA